MVFAEAVMEWVETGLGRWVGTRCKRLTCYVKVLALSEKVCELILGSAELCKQCHPCPLYELEKRLSRQWPVLGASPTAGLSSISLSTHWPVQSYMMPWIWTHPRGGSQTRAFQQPLLWFLSSSSRKPQKLCLCYVQTIINIHCVFCIRSHL